ncbi:MFS transporter [Nisaea sediminum]|uniref:MFS transporter n=1 Tax=Nisaea sediminum TaxID=2775867 RepID=UPI001866C8E2|nr:MFS transporter [Nisaea sediminum]
MTDSHVPWSEILTRSSAPSLSLVCLGVWLHAADSLIVATMMPAIIDGIGGGELVAWSIALYEIGTIIAGAAGAFLTVRFGLRAPMATAAFLFAVGCIVSALAPAMPILLGGRLIQGLGGGGLMALSFVAANRLFPARLIPRAIASMSALWGASSFIGPLIGGLFVAHADWRAGFGFFALQALTLGLWILFARSLSVLDAGRRSPHTGGLPIFRLTLVAAGVVLIAYAGIEIGPVATPVLALSGLLCLAGFLLAERRAGDRRMLPKAPFGIASAPASALTMILFLAAATIAIGAYGPLLLVRLHGLSALAAGYMLALSSVSWTFFALIVSGISERHDPRFIALGMLCVGASILGFVFSVPEGPLWLIALSTILEGGGFGIAWVFILRRATSLAPPEEADRISAAIPTMQRLGFALGAAYIGIVANAAGFASADKLTELADIARWIFASCLAPGLAGLVAAACFLLPHWRIKLPIPLSRQDT